MCSIRVYLDKSVLGCEQALSIHYQGFLQYSTQRSAVRLSRYFITKIILRTLTTFSPFVVENTYRAPINFEVRPHTFTAVTADTAVGSPCWRGEGHGPGRQLR